MARKKQRGGREQVGTRWTAEEIEAIKSHAEDTKDSFNGVVSKSVAVGLPILQSPEYWTARLVHKMRDEDICKLLKDAIKRKYGQ